MTPLPSKLGERDGLVADALVRVGDTGILPLRIKMGRFASGQLERDATFRSCAVPVCSDDPILLV